MPCSTPGCARTPQWRPSLDLRSRKDGSPTRLTFVKLAYCDEDKEKAKLETFLSDEGFSKIARHLRERGKEVPVQKLTTLAWTRLDATSLAALSSDQDQITPDDTLPF
jgi:hypothetical protein